MSNDILFVIRDSGSDLPKNDKRNKCDKDFWGYIDNRFYKFILKMNNNYSEFPN